MDGSQLCRSKFLFLLNTNRVLQNEGEICSAPAQHRKETAPWLKSFAFELEFCSLERLRYNFFLFFFIIILGGNLNVTARKPGCIHHLTLFLLGWLVREFPGCRKGLCFGKNYLFQVDWNTICHIWQSEWNKVQEVFVAAWKEILSNLTFMLLEVSVVTKGHVLTFPTDSSPGCSATSSSMVIYDFVRNSFPFPELPPALGHH